MLTGPHAFKPTGSLIKLAGAPVAYKTQFQDTVATLSTESEFMAAYELGKMLLYVRSILWDLNVPQEAASQLYEDNDTCTAMANAQKPTSCTRHMDIRYHVLCEWVKRDLIVLERVDTTINEADHFTKLLSRVLFHRHIEYIMGHVPPEYLPAHARSTGQFDKPLVTLVPESYTTKDTLPIAIPEDDNYILVAARAARIYSPDYSALANNHWTKISASTSCLPYNPILCSTSLNCWGVLAYIGLTT
jgi:hypothetical protein